MNQTAIFWPILAHIFLVFIVYVVLAVKRTQAIRQAGAKIRDYKTRNNEPEFSQNAANNLLSQFEAPVVFHVLCLMLYATSGVTYFVLLMAWIYAITRYLHSFFHITTNNLRLRSMAFWPPLLILLVLWLVVVLRLASAA